MSERATVAVLAIAADPQDHAVTRGVAAEVATALVRTGIAVTNRPQSARYHLRGTLRRDGPHCRVTFHLVEPATGRHVWVHRHDGNAEDIFLFEERVAASIAAAIHAGLRAAEVHRARSKPDADLTPHDLALRALPHALAFNVDGNGRALDLLGRAIDHDPDHALSTALAAWCHAQRSVLHLFSSSPAWHRAEAIRLARRAISLGGDATVFAVLGNALALANDLEMAASVTHRALAIDGSSAWAWGRSGLLDVYQGNLASGTERLLIALDLAPADPLAFTSMLGIGCAHFQTGDYVAAARWLTRAVSEHPSAVWAHQMLCPAYMLSGNKEQATIV